MSALRWFQEHDGFALRLALLAGVMLLVAGVDLALKRRHATRWREYAFLLLMATLGSVAGMGVDLVTSSISPDYFIVGKGLEDGPAFRLEVLKVGAQAGFVAGCFVAGALLVANASSKVFPSLRLRRIARYCLSILLLALASAAAAGCLATFLELQIPFETSTSVRVSRLPQFNAVWWTHLGAYGGALLGLAVRVHSVRQERCREAQRAT